MRRLVAVGLLLLLVVLPIGCAVEPPVEFARVKPIARPIDYLTEIKPILDRRCVVCHSCYNSPCQLKLSSYEGLDRGASKERVYDAHRLFTAQHTRLFVDAQSTRGWRGKGFYSVSENHTDDGVSGSFLERMLSHKMAHPQSACSASSSDACNSFVPEREDLTCAATTGELDSYLLRHPNWGMPYGFPPLEQREFQLVGNWLAQGGRGPTPAEEAALSAVASADRRAVDTWERFLNRGDAKHRMTARYLYEHLFLAHVAFSPSTKTFYELVRSRTAPGRPVDLIPSIRPYDDPGTDTFYYRFRRITSTIVYKTHMVFRLSEAKLHRIEQLFIEPRWLEKPHVMSYQRKEGANPFAVFEQIPPRSRYQFLLDNSRYIIMTFIRGPVCKGQIALNVIRDHFWLFFLDPDHDLSVLYPGFLKENLNLLRIPTEQGSTFSLLKFWMIPRYRRRAARYVKARQDYYSMSYSYRGLGADAIWAGEKPEDSPVLTVYRHFDSASVMRGARGACPAPSG